MTNLRSKLGLLFAITALLALPLVGCVEEQGPAEKAGEKIDEAIDEVGDAFEDTGEKINDKVEDVTDGNA